jgi:hypothetical protein
LDFEKEFAQLKTQLPQQDAGSGDNHPENETRQPLL